MTTTVIAKRRRLAGAVATSLTAGLASVGVPAVATAARAQPSQDRVRSVVVEAAGEARAAAIPTYTLRVLPRPVGYAATSVITDVHVNDRGRAMVNLAGRRLRGCFVTSLTGGARWLMATAAQLGAQSPVRIVQCADMSTAGAVIGTVSSDHDEAVVWSPAGIPRVLPSLRAGTSRRGQAVNDIGSRFVSEERGPRNEDTAETTTSTIITSAAGTILRSVTKDVWNESYLGVDVTNAGAVYGTGYLGRWVSAAYLMAPWWARVPAPDSLFEGWYGISGMSPRGSWIVGWANNAYVMPYTDRPVRYRGLTSSYLAGARFYPKAVNEVGTIVGNGAWPPSEDTETVEPTIWRAGISRRMAPLVRNLPKGWALKSVTSINTLGVIGGVVRNARGIELPMTLTPR